MGGEKWVRGKFVSQRHARIAAPEADLCVSLVQILEEKTEMDNNSRLHADKIKINLRSHAFDNDYAMQIYPNASCAELLYTVCLQQKLDPRFCSVVCLSQSRQS